MKPATAAIPSDTATNFYYSFTVLPRDKREAIRTVYAFCRYTDDLVDEEADERRRVALLRKWRMELGRAIRGESELPLLNQLAGTAHRFHIPVGYFYSLIRGVEMDLTKTRYETFDELRDYCMLVASSVGLMCREIFGYRNESTADYAVNLGIALQLTNIIRDVRDDARKGRIYLPQEDLRRFACTEDDLLSGKYSPEFVNLMRFQVERAKQYFQKAQNALRDDDKHYFFAARIMWSIYAHILRRIERLNYNVLDRRVSISKPLKLLITLRYWLSHHLKYSHA